MEFENVWEEWEDFWENFGIRIGPFGLGMCGPRRRYVRYSRTDTSHILQIRISPKVKKDQIKARLIRPGLVEIEWPRAEKAEDIPVK